MSMHNINYCFYNLIFILFNKVSIWIILIYEKFKQILIKNNLNFINA